MRRVLLDTHAYLWFVYDDARLSEAAATNIADSNSAPLLSVVSLWEIVVKNQLGKLQLGMAVDRFFTEHVYGRRLDLVAIETRHLVEYSNLPLLHRDPFDRMIVAQALSLDVPVVTGDPWFAPYGVDVIW